MAVVLNPYRLVAVSSYATFIGEASTVGTTITLHANTQAGDLVVVFLGENAGIDQPTGGGAGTWTPISFSTTRVFYKTVVAGDLGVSLDFDASLGSVTSALIALTFRGASTVTSKDTSQGTSQSSLDLTGFSPTGSTKGVVTFAKISNQAFSGTPTGFTGTDSEGGTNFTAKGGYDVTLNYSGSTVTWNFTGVVTDSYNILLELT